MTADAVGGVWQYASTLATGLAARRFEVVLATLGPQPSAEQAAMVEAHRRVTLLRTDLPLDWMSEPQAVNAAGAKVAALARETGADLIHLNSPALAGYARFDGPAIAVAHGCLATWWDAARGGPLDPAFRWHAEATARGFRAADLAIAPSSSFAETLRHRYRLSRAPAVVHNGRTFAAPQAAGKPERAALTVGRMWDDVKNAGVLDEAAALLSVPFAAAGATTGPHGESIRLQHLQALGHISAAELAGRLSRRPIFVSAATFEPFGLAVLEAASAGCALILSDIATFRELWDGAATFVQPDNPAGYAAAIERLLATPAERMRLGEAAWEHAAHYSAERMVEAMATHYRAVLARRAVLEPAA